MEKTREYMYVDTYTHIYIYISFSLKSWIHTLKSNSNPTPRFISSYPFCIKNSCIYNLSVFIIHNFLIVRNVSTIVNILTYLIRFPVCNQCAIFPDTFPLPRPPQTLSSLCLSTYLFQVVPAHHVNNFITLSLTPRNKLPIIVDTLLTPLGLTSHFWATICSLSPLWPF